MLIRTRFKTVSFVFILLALTSCGGGGGSDDSIGSASPSSSSSSGASVTSASNSSSSSTSSSSTSSSSSGSSAVGAGITANPIISHGAQIYVSHNTGSATNLNDDDLGSSWHSGDAGGDNIVTPSWVAYNLGVGPSRVMVYWLAETWGTYRSPDWTLVDYSIQVSADSSDGADGTWQDVVIVTGNEFGSREHAFDFTGYSWVRLYITGWNKAGQWGRGAIRTFDVHNASQGTQDTMFFYGDSITQSAFRRGVQPDYAANIHSMFPSHTPMMIGGGIGGTTASNWGAEVNDLAAMLPDVQYWMIAFGMNDSWGDAVGSVARVATFKERMRFIVASLLAAGRTPILAQISWATPANEHGGIPAYNIALRELEQEYSLIPGPDLYTYFENNPGQLADGVHPDDDGVVAMNLIWAQHMQSLYQ